jgi:lysophospholipase L1-like esterase
MRGYRLSIRFWVITLIVGCSFNLSCFAEAKPAVDWVGTWAASPMACPVNSGEPSVGDSTYRNVIRISIGGKRFRVQLTNEFGTTQLRVDSAHIAIDSGSGTIKSDTDHTLTFGGRPSVAIPAGGFMLSDEVAIEAPALSSLTVSLHVADQVLSTRSCHILGSSTNYVAKGDATGATKMKDARNTHSWNFVKGIDVGKDKDSFAIVALGDSITDGNASTRDANHRWTDYLSDRLQKIHNKTQIAVLNEGIIGNRILRAELGENAIARFDRDVLTQSGARYLILLEGINDINWTDDSSQNASAEELIAGVSQLIERAHTHGIAVFAATLTPYGGADGFSEKGDLVRTALNQWYRTAGVVDGVIDFDEATRDPSKPARLNPIYDSGDHLHPNDAGYEAMARSIRLSLFSVDCHRYFAGRCEVRPSHAA